jgi:hypothetical protein
LHYASITVITFRLSLSDGNKRKRDQSSTNSLPQNVLNAVKAYGKAQERQGWQAI